MGEAKDGGGTTNDGAVKVVERSIDSCIGAGASYEMMGRVGRDATADTLEEGAEGRN
jgi:hypothetical protein